MKSRISQLWRDESGQDLIEYALLLALFTIVVAAILPTTLVPTLVGILTQANSTLTAS